VQHWIFTIGTRDEPPPEDWLSAWGHSPGELWFPEKKRPVSVEQGDRAVLYGSNRGFIAAVEVISDAIKESDNSYFFENYTKQANAVINALKKHGYVIVPYYPTVEMVKAAMDELQYGQNKFTNIVMPIYLAMMKSAPKPR